MPHRQTEPRAPSIRPLLEGDAIGDLRIRGFAWSAPSPDRRSNHHDDALLLDGDELCPDPPDRPVPQTADDAVAAAPMPPDDLDPGQVRPAAAIDPAIPARVEALLDLPHAPWRRLTGPLFAAVHATGHRLWLAGGAVRDTICGVAPEEIKDLDMSGTAPPGRFCDMTYQAMRAAGMSEYTIEVSRSSLICAVVTTRPRVRLVEYRGLSLGGFPFPAVGSRLREDARHRDFSFNALMYDVLEHEVYDPTGHGVADLVGPVRRFAPWNRTQEPAQRAEIILRTMKFALRWADQATLDLAPLHAWIAGIPADEWRKLTAQNWDSLRRKRRRDIPQPDAVQAAFAATLPEAGRDLLMRLIAGGE